MQMDDSAMQSEQLNDIGDMAAIVDDSVEAGGEKSAARNQETSQAKRRAPRDKSGGRSQR